MMGTFNCTYETPCGWCIKWDKKCDRKIPERENGIVCRPIDSDQTITLYNKICKSQSDHQWKLCTASTEGNTYECEKCGEMLFIPYENLNHTTTSGL